MKKLIVVVMALLANNAWAEGEDLERCVYKNGSPMGDDICAMFRKIKADNDAANQSQSENVCDFPITVNGKPSYKTAPCPKGEFMASCHREITDEKGWTRGETIPCPPGQRKTIDQIHREEEAAQKRKCGKDYMAIRVGMAIERLKDCHGASYVTKTVTQDGVIETYRTMFDMVNVKDGRIVSYTKRRY